MLEFLNRTDVKKYLSVRKGEVKLGERVQVLRKGETLNALKSYKERGARYALLGIPESVGVKANLGQPGTEKAWEAFLKSFLNIQSNRFLEGNELLFLGQVDVKDIQDRALKLPPETSYYLQKLHILCAEVDEQVQPVIAAIVNAGLIPIVIGGGHNNAFPIINGVAEALERKRGINAINFDAHADFRALEGRHSGNGFSYAKEKGSLYKYFAFGLHESYNGEHMLFSMDNTRNVRYKMLEDINYLDKDLMEAIDFVHDEHVPCGVELDMDAIRLMPSSAVSPSGFSLEQARHYVRKCARSLKTAYLHLPEAAPFDAPSEKMVGKALAYLVADFVKGAR